MINLILCKFDPKITIHVYREQASVFCNLMNHTLMGRDVDIIVDDFFSRKGILLPRKERERGDPYP